MPFCVGEPFQQMSLFRASTSHCLLIQEPVVHHLLTVCNSKAEPISSFVHTD